MAFLPKSWANSPTTTTPLSAAALQDLEARVTAIGWGGVTPQTGVSYTAVAGDVVYANPSSGGQTITLPAVATSTTVTIVAGSSVSNGNQITVNRASSATISGKGLSAATSFNLISAGDNVTLTSDGINWYIVAGQFGLTGAVNIAASEGRSSNAYSTLTTPDQVTNIVLPTNGLIAVWYQAIWQETVANTGRAAIFIGANQLTIQGQDGPFTQAALKPPASAVLTNTPLATAARGLVTLDAQAANTGNVTTGQLVGLIPYGASTNGVATEEVNGAVHTIGSGAYPTLAGPCYIFAAAGTYTVSVQFRTTSGTVTASNRKLWVEAKPF